MRWQNLLLLAVLGTVNGVRAEAASITRSGVFIEDDEFALLEFRLEAPGTVFVETNSYVRGGFYPALALFGEDLGQFRLTGVSFGNGGVCGVGVTPPPDGICEDIRWQGFLMAGNYIAILTVFPNLALGPNLEDGFLLEGQGNFTGMFSFGGGGPFLDPSGNPRTGEWDLTVSGDNVAAQAEVPEPANLGIWILGLGYVWARRRKS